MSKREIKTFTEYVSTLRGDEKGEAQVFLDRLFQAFGHKGYKEAGAVLEERLKEKGKATRFADLIWEGRLILEMKTRGENLQKHFQQLRYYWDNYYTKEVGKNKPPYAVLCNFDEFWIYNFNIQPEPVDKISIDELVTRRDVFNFFLPRPKKPIFNNNTEEVSRKAAEAVTAALSSLVQRGFDKKDAQHFILQCCFCMFAEDFDLLPHNIFTEILYDCREGGQSTYDLIGGLFEQMATKKKAKGGRFKDVEYFDGSLFGGGEPFELNEDEVDWLWLAAKEDWTKVQPPIFGAIFEGSMDASERHRTGAHFTSEVDIRKIVEPTIERPWYEGIDSAKSFKDLVSLRKELLRFQVLDPACGCGNFLYVAYREMKLIELTLLHRIYEVNPKKATKDVPATSLVALNQFHGIDINPFAVELAKVTMLMAKQLAARVVHESAVSKQIDLDLDYDNLLPLDNLDAQFKNSDALFCKWPKVDAIIGNPPFMDARKLTIERGEDYARCVRSKYEDIPGRADYCVYWFRRSHDELTSGKRAGLVGTNTIRQNYSRMGGLDYIVGNKGTITEAVSSQVWSGDAVVHVSIVNWVKKKSEDSPKKLYEQIGDNIFSPLVTWKLKFINSSLSAKHDVSKAKEIISNKKPKLFWEGQQTGEINFVLSSERMEKMAQDEPNLADVVYFYTNGDDLLSGRFFEDPTFVIDYGEVGQFTAQQYKEPFNHIKKYVLPVWKERAVMEFNRTGQKKGEHQNRLQTWWKMKRRRKALIDAITPLKRYIGFVATSRRQIFMFISSKIRPSNAIKVWALDDNYSFGVMQSNLHWEWATARCSTLKRDFRYTPETVFKQFPWPQTPTVNDLISVGNAASELLTTRNNVMSKMNWSLRQLHKASELSESNELVQAQDSLNEAVRKAYGFRKNCDSLEALMDLNQECVSVEDKGGSVVGPGIPIYVEEHLDIVTDQQIEPPEKWSQILFGSA